MDNLKINEYYVDPERGGYKIIEIDEENEMYRIIWTSHYDKHLNGDEEDVHFYQCKGDILQRACDSKLYKKLLEDK